MIFWAAVLCVALATSDKVWAEDPPATGAAPASNAAAVPATQPATAGAPASGTGQGTSSTDLQELNKLDKTPWSVDTGGVNGSNAVSKLVASVMDRIPVYLGAFALIAILYSGGLYIASMGDPNKMEIAKKNLTWTLYGIIASSSVYAIIQLILWITSKTTNAIPS